MKEKRKTTDGHRLTQIRLKKPFHPMDVFLFFGNAFLSVSIGVHLWFQLLL
jgi:hypothetical protein